MNSLFHNFLVGSDIPVPMLTCASAVPGIETGKPGPPPSLSLSEAPAKSVHYTYNLNIENSINHQNYELD